MPSVRCAGPADAGPATVAAMDPVLRHLIANARSEAVRLQFLQTPAAEYTTTQDVRILAGSYNVNGRAPPSSTDLREWLAVRGPHGEPDLVAVGFQELVPLNASNVVMGASPRLIFMPHIDEVALLCRHVHAKLDACITIYQTPSSSVLLHSQVLKLDLGHLIKHDRKAVAKNNNYSD